MPVGDLPNRALPVIVELDRRQRLSMKEFTLASGILAESAKGLRVRLEELGVVEVRSLGRRGVVEPKEIRLTPMGRKLAAHVSAMNDILAQHREGRAGAKRERA